ncbi:hypothetical protein BLNAU_2297 [Blattamonas nauphoetae]|uniref:Transmembrane protein n=1 Tax=Blattamonas nauphoetae TaxID=2049346 RepID=A0ABQ9YGI4_9EUKA|nr:hypothetical protein BLNAU_2297 [Blattamonas nauphoetae]
MCSMGRHPKPCACITFVILNAIVLPGVLVTIGFLFVGLFTNPKIFYLCLAGILIDLVFTAGFILNFIGSCYGMEGKNTRQPVLWGGLIILTFFYMFHSLVAALLLHGSGLSREWPLTYNEPIKTVNFVGKDNIQIQSIQPAAADSNDLELQHDLPFTTEQVKQQLSLNGWIFFGIAIVDLVIVALGIRILGAVQGMKFLLFFTFIYQIILTLGLFAGFIGSFFSPVSAWIRVALGIFTVIVLLSACFSLSSSFQLSYLPKHAHTHTCALATQIIPAIVFTLLFLGTAAASVICFIFSSSSPFVPATGLVKSSAETMSTDSLEVNNPLIFASVEAVCSQQSVQLTPSHRKSNSRQASSASPSFLPHQSQISPNHFCTAVASDLATIANCSSSPARNITLERSLKNVTDSPMDTNTVISLDALLYNVTSEKQHEICANLAQASTEYLTMKAKDAFSTVGVVFGVFSGFVLAMLVITFIGLLDPWKTKGLDRHNYVRYREQTSNE